MIIETPHRFIKALFRQPVDRTPVWMMRQAGRYLPEYRQTRARAGSFMNLCKQPELATEVSLQPLKRFPQLDAAILFSDILTIPDAMGLGLDFEENEGPRFERPIRHKSDIQNLPKISSKKDLDYVMTAISTIRHRLHNKWPLIGFSGSPWTLATYMIEGRSKTDFSLIKSMLYSDPKALHQLLSLLSEVIIDYLNQQIEHGVQAIQIFDTWGGVLSHQAYHDFSLHYMHRIVQALHKTYQQQPIPTILFTKGAGNWLEMMADSGANALGLDWTIRLSDAKKRVGHKVALQGNMDPVVLTSNPETVQQQVRQLLQDFAFDGNSHGHIFNLGHGISPKTNPAYVSVMLETIENYF